jgi:hypothetical protein
VDCRSGRDQDRTDQYLFDLTAGTVTLGAVLDLAG